MKAMISRVFSRGEGSARRAAGNSTVSSELIDGRIRKVVNASVILEGTHFAGLWFQASSGTEGSPKALLGMPCELVHQSGGAEVIA